MGIVDQFVVSLKCPHCGSNEEGKVVDKGSSFSGPSWINRTDFKNFKVTWLTGKVANPPTIDKATCSECGSDAEVSSSFRT